MLYNSHDIIILTNLVHVTDVYLCLPAFPAVSCGNPGNVEHASAFGTVWTYPSVVLYICDAGYVMLGVPMLECLSTGSWNAPKPKCAPVNCSELATPKNGVVSKGSRSFGSTVFFHCVPGYDLVGDGNVTCLANKQWSSPPAICTAIECIALSAPSYGMITSVNVTFTGLATFKCMDGYVPTGGSSTRQCTANHTWDRQVLICNGERTPCMTVIWTSTCNIVYHDACSYHCVTHWAQILCSVSIKSHP